MNYPLPRTVQIPADLIVVLGDAAVAGARKAAAKFTRRARRRIGDTLKPGPDTPLWNALAVAVTAQFRRRGDRARLARILRLPRQRITEMLRRKHHLPDAERTLTLLLWLNARRHGEDLG